MKISELSAATDVPVGTIKFYLREGLLPAGERTSRTTARYGQGHVERIRLVRALTDAGGLGIDQVRRVITVIDADDPPRLDVLATAQDALVGGDLPVGAHECSAAPDAGYSSQIRAPQLREPGEPGEPGEPDESGESGAPGESDESAPGPEVPGEPDGSAPESGDLIPSRARTWAARRNWFSYDGDRVIERFESAWAACEEAGVDVDEARMDEYADAVERIARIDVGSLPAGADDAVRRVIVGTVMLEPVLAALRLLAQRQIAVTDHQGGSGDT